MSSIVIKGDTSGQIEIAAPAVAGSTTLTLPTGSGDFITADSSGNVNIDSGTLYVDATNNNVGIGTTSPNSHLTTQTSSTSTSAFDFGVQVNNSYASNDSIAAIGFHNRADVNGTGVGGAIAYVGGGASGGSGNITFNIKDNTDISNVVDVADEKMRIDSSGDVLVGTTSKSNIAGVPPHHMFVRSAADGQWTLSLQNTAASGGARGLCINYSGQSPNNTNMEPMFFSDSVNYRFALRSNGGIANYSANDVNLSDRREKTNFAPAKSYLQTICSIPVQTFNYIDQNLQEDDGLTLGVVAQDVQAVAPELVTESDWGSDGNPKMRLSVYQTDLTYALMKCIQEQQEIIKALETRIQALESNP